MIRCSSVFSLSQFFSACRSRMGFRFFPSKSEILTERVSFHENEVRSSSSVSSLFAIIWIRRITNLLFSWTDLQRTSSPQWLRVGCS